MLYNRDACSCGIRQVGQTKFARRKRVGRVAADMQCVMIQCIRDACSYVLRRGDQIKLCPLNGKGR